MTYEMKSTQKKAFVAHVEVLSQHLLGRTEKTMGTAGLKTKILS
jgi:hypothetical protein